MATGETFLRFILEQLSAPDGITHRRMMGEYILYRNGRILAYLCDDRLLIKPSPAAVQQLPNAVYEPPYPGAKPMILVENVDDRVFLTELFKAITPDLSAPKAATKATAKKR